MAGQADNAIELEIFRQLFASAAEEMGYRLMRSAYSPNIKERRDYSCALFDRNADMVAQAAHIPVHLGSTPMSVAAVLEKFPAEDMAAGDRFILNDPFAGGTHLPDITVVAPAFVGEANGGGGPAFFVANRAHHADVGGTTPGSMGLTRSIEQEGLRIGPTKIGEDTLREIADQTRTPDERLGDLQAQLAAANVGIQRLVGLCERYGAATVGRRAAGLMDYSARLVRAIIREIPDGEYDFTDHLDGDGYEAEEIAIRCVLTIEGESAKVDLSDSDDQVAGPMNAVRSIAISAVNYCFRCLGAPDMPSNAGVMRPIEVVTRRGSVVDAEPPAAVAGGNVETSQRIVDVVLGALAQALPDRIPAASCGSMNNITIGPADGDENGGGGWAYYETIAGGAGAGPGGPGQHAVHTHMTNTLNTPIEAIEHAYPFRIDRYAIRRGSGGGGEHRGGDGVVRRYRFDEPAQVTLLTERRCRGAWGAAGGGAGEPGEDRLIDGDGSSRTLAAKGGCEAGSGQCIEIMTPGGGGYGQSGGDG